MTRLFVLFLMVLLPLRGWSIEAMAVAMAAGQVQQVAGELAGMSAECALTMQTQTQTAAGDSTQASPDHQPDHKTCQTCQLCMPLAAAETLAIAVAQTTPHTLPPLASPAYASADPSRHAKPPIS